MSMQHFFTKKVFKNRNQSNIIYMKKYILIFLPILFFFKKSYGQPGSNGAVTITSPNTKVNCYEPITSNVTAGQTSVTIANINSCGLSYGDLVMIYQAQGATINTSDNAQYGEVTNYNSAGLYEFAYVICVNGNTVVFQDPLVNSYTTNGKVQLIKVPQYTTLTINSGASITASPWSDYGAYRYGGVVAIHATNQIIVNGEITVSDKGFRAGNLDNSSNQNYSSVTSIFRSTSPGESAEKGESIAGYGPEYDAMGGAFWTRCTG